MRSLIYILLIIVIIGGGYAGWYFLSGATDEQIRRMIDTANRSGADTFENMTAETERQIFKAFKKLSKKEIERLIVLFAMKESDWTQADLSDFRRLFQKGSGRRMGS